MLNNTEFTSTATMTKLNKVEDIQDLEKFLLIWIDEVFSSSTIEQLEERGYAKFSQKVVTKLYTMGCNRVLDRPTMDCLWIKTVAKLWNKREVENPGETHDVSELNIMFMEVCSYIPFLICLMLT